MSWASILKVDEEKPKRTDYAFSPTPKKTKSPYSDEDQKRQAEPVEMQEKKDRKPKTGRNLINEYALKLRDILSKYGDRGTVDKDIISDIKQSTILFRRTQLPNIFHVLSPIGSENIDKLRAETDRDVKPLQKRLSANYGGKSGYDILEEIYESSPEMKGRRMNPKLRQDLMRDFTAPKSGLPRIIKDMETISEFSFEGKKGTDALSELKDYVEEVEKIVEVGEASIPTDRIDDYRKKKDEIEKKEAELKEKTTELLRRINPNDSLKFMNFIDEMTGRGVISEEAKLPESENLRMKVPSEPREIITSARKYGFTLRPSHAKTILVIGKAKIKLKEARDQLSYELKELEEDIKGTASGEEISLSQFKEYGEALVKNKKILDDFTVTIENNLDTLEERLTEMEAEGVRILREKAKEYLPVLKKYIDFAEELDLYVDQDAMEFVERLTKLLKLQEETDELYARESTRMVDFDLDSAMREAKEGEKDE